MTLGIAHIAGIALVLALMISVGVYSGRKVSDAADFTTGGGKAGPWLVAGTIMGTLVSGQATVGTAQLAFSFGMSAWWFTLGAGLGCLVLALGYAAPMRRGGATTLVGVISGEYGDRCGYVASVLSSVGIFISVIAQMISATALLTAILPIGMPAAALISAAVMAAYVIFGGVWGAGLGGVVKLALLYGAAVAGGVVALAAAGGLSGVMGELSGALLHTGLGSLNGIAGAGDLTARYGSLLARGPLNDLGAGLSLVVGVLSTQTYASAIWSAKSSRAAKRGALISACLIPPIGIMCILIGLFMRGRCITAAEAEALRTAGQAIPAGMLEIAGTAQVFPAFILRYLPKFAGGIILGTLLMTIVGGGAGLSLGVATIVSNDILGRLTRRLDAPKRRLAATRAVIITVLAAAALSAILMPSAVINDFGYLSMGLRGAVAFAPLCTALFLPGRIPPRFAFAAIVAGPVVVLAGKLALPAGLDPLFPGLAAALVILAAGLAAGQKAGGALKHS